MVNRIVMCGQMGLLVQALRDRLDGASCYTNASKRTDCKPMKSMSLFQVAVVCSSSPQRQLLTNNSASHK